MGDTLLEVNGVSANAPQLVLRKALQAATDVRPRTIQPSHAYWRTHDARPHKCILPPFPPPLLRQVAVLKVMRANADPVRSAGRYNVPVKPAEAVKMATKKEEPPLWGLFGCCSANRPAVAA